MQKGKRHFEVNTEINYTKRTLEIICVAVLQNLQKTFNCCLELRYDVNLIFTFLFSYKMKLILLPYI